MKLKSLIIDRRLFWSDWNRNGPRIEAANLDGSNRMSLVDNLVGKPNSLILDFQRYQLCWTDGGSSQRYDRPEVQPKIECMNMNGGGRRPLLTLEKGQIPYGIALTPNNVFYTDWTR